MATIVEATTKLGGMVVNADGSARVTGHSLRVTGAQGLSKIGVDTWAIQLLGRWGSATVLDYIKDVPLELASTWAKRAAKQSTLDDLTLRPSIRSSSSSAASSSQPAALPRASIAPLSRALVAERDTCEEERGHASDIKFLRSSSGIWHKVLPSGRVGPISSWSTRCGWQFSRSEARLEDDLPPRTLSFSKCLRCGL